MTTRIVGFDNVCMDTMHGRDGSTAICLRPPGHDGPHREFCSRGPHRWPQGPNDEVDQCLECLRMFAAEPKAVTGHVKVSKGRNPLLSAGPRYAWRYQCPGCGEICAGMSWAVAVVRGVEHQRTCEGEPRPEPDGVWCELTTCNYRAGHRGPHSGEPVT